MPFLHPTYIISILIAVAVHEWAHAVTAHRFGDPTPEHAGRLTLNPVAHIDPLGALMFLLVGFGWAKPVPVNSSYFRHPKREMALTALAGPFANLCLALIAFVGLSFLSDRPGAGSVFALLSPMREFSVGATLLLQILRSSLFVNLALMAFNLFPIAPLDGSNVLRLFIPWQHERRYEEIMRLGPFILLFLIFFESLLPFRILSGWVHGIMEAVLSLFLWMMGVMGM